jgi:hypothetical protein
VINGEHVSDGQASRAHAIRGIVQCAFHNDQSAAQADLRAGLAARDRKRLRDGCAAAGMKLDAAQ